MVWIEQALETWIEQALVYAPACYSGQAGGADMVALLQMNVDASLRVLAVAGCS